MNFKDALRKDTNYLRGLGHLDSELRQNWIRSNAARLQQARSKLTDEDYRNFAGSLYKIQLWNSMEAGNISKGVYGNNFKPTMSYINNYFNQKVADIDFTLKYHPDLDENNIYVGSKKNTGFSPELWNIYSNLKDEKSKKEFRDKIITEDKVWDTAAGVEAMKNTTSDINRMNNDPTEGPLGNGSPDLTPSDPVSGLAQKFYNWLGKATNSNWMVMEEGNTPGSASYYKKNKDKISGESFNQVKDENAKIAQAIYSKSLKNWRNSKNYQQELKATTDAINARWNEDFKKDKKGAESAHQQEFLDAVKDNPLLAAASGYDPKTGEFSHKKFQQFSSLMEEDPSFKAKYLAQKNLLAEQVQDGKISEDDYRQSLADIAGDALKDHESFGTRASNAIKGALTTGMTYTLHKFAPFVNGAELVKKHTDGKVFLDAYGNVYSDSDITSNARRVDKNDADSAVLYRTSNGDSINYNKDGDKIFVKDGQSYIYQGEDGEFKPVDANTIDMHDEHLRKVSEIPVRNTKVGDHDLMRLGKDDSGNDLNWGDGLFNQRYLQMADRYNILPTAGNREALDYYNQFGYSNWVNVQRPGDDSHDFIGETVKMMGFVGADLLETSLSMGMFKGAGKLFGATAGTMDKLGNVSRLLTGTLGAVGIADSYAQGVFDENVARNEQTLQQVISDRAKEKAEAWAQSSGKAEIDKAYNEAVKAIEKKQGRPLTESEKAQLQMSVRANVINNKAIQIYGEDVKSPDYLDKQEKAISDAGWSSIVDFAGEGLKYGIVNTLGFRKWMFSGSAASANKAAALASEKTLFGKAFSRVGRATAEDVAAANAAGKTLKEGDLILTKAWSKMTPKEKSWEILKATGKQAWGGAWTNWTDEMQSAGAKAQNNAAFDLHVSNNDVNGAMLFANAAASHLKAIAESAADENSIWAGLIGGAGSVLGFGFNPMGVVEAVTDREGWNRKSAGEKFNSIFSNSVLSDVYQQRANDIQAEKMLDRANSLISSVSGNANSLMNALNSASKIGHSESEVEEEEKYVIGLFNTLQAIKNFSETNPGLAELDATKSLKEYAENAAKLANLNNLSEEEKADYIEKIKEENPTMTEEQATTELETVSRKAKLMQEMLEKYNELLEDKEYTQAAVKGEGKSRKQENMEDKHLLESLNNYTLQNMKEREKKIKGSSTIHSIDRDTPEVEGEDVTNTRAAENNELVTYGTTKRALKNTLEAFRLAESRLLETQNNLIGARKSLNYEKRVAELNEKIDTASPSEKEALLKQLDDLERDRDYYDSRITGLDSAIEENKEHQWRIEQLFNENFAVQAAGESKVQVPVLSADEILSLDPIARARMLDANNRENYSKKQQTQIRKAISKMIKNGGSMIDVQNQALAQSRYKQREEMLESLAVGDPVNPSLNTRVSTMIQAAHRMVEANVRNEAKRALKNIEDEAATEEEARTRKINLLKQYSPDTLKYMRYYLRAKDKKLLDEILPMAETGGQLVDLIWDNNYGLTGLNHDERQNLQNVVALYSQVSNSDTELIENLAQYAADATNPSINTLLDKLAQVYEQQHATVVETAKEKAQRQAEERRAAAAREEAAQAALKAAEEAPAETPKEKSPASKNPISSVETSITPASPAAPAKPAQKTTLASALAEEGLRDAASSILKDAQEDIAKEKAELEKANVEGEELKSTPKEREYYEGKTIEEWDKAVETLDKEIKGLVSKGWDIKRILEHVSAEEPFYIVVGTLKGRINNSLTDYIDNLIKERRDNEGSTSEDLIKHAKDNILATQSKVQPLSERDPHAEFYLIDGEQYTRVHGAMGDVWVGEKKPSAEANKERGLKNGSLVDGIVRDFFNGTTPTKPAHFSQEAFDALITSLETIKARLIANSEEFLTNNIVLYHKFPNGVKIAGEADIVSIKIVDGKPQYNIYDLKTSARDFNKSDFWETDPNAGVRNTVIGTREQYTNQVSLYKLLFERMLNTPITNLGLLPYKLTYDAADNVTGIEKFPGIALTYNKNVEKMVAYQPAVEEALNRIQLTYKGMFTKSQLNTLKGTILNGIVKGESFSRDIENFLYNQELSDQFKAIGKEKLAPIIKDLKEAVSKINVEETLKEEYKAPEPPVTPPSPAELATVEPTGNEYSPEKDSYAEPDVDAEFNKLGEDPGSTELPQTAEITEEVTDMDTTTNELENIDINEEEGEVAETIKANAMSPYVYEDKTAGVEDNERQDAKRGILIEKTPGESMQNFRDWMSSRKIHLQELIDEKLSDILSTGTKDHPVKIRFMRVNPNMTSVGNDKMKTHYLLTVEDSPAIRKVYTAKDIAKYGDFVKANGKQYLIVGVAGFANSKQGKACRKILTDGKNSVQVKSNEYFKANAEEEFFVDQDKYTHVARIHSGFITKQLASDSMPQVRRLSELLEGPEKDVRNPLGLTWDDLVFGYQMRNEFRTVPEVDEEMYHSPAKAKDNIGNVFLFIKGTDGKFTPTYIIPTRYSEIAEGCSIQTKIQNALRQITSPSHQKRYEALMELYKLVVIGQKDADGKPTGNNILIGTEKNPSLEFRKNDIPIYSTDLKNVNFQEVLENFARLDPRISITKTKLLNTEDLKELDAAGALRTDVARLCKSAGDYAVYNIDSATGQPITTESIIPSRNSVTSRGEATHFFVDGQRYTMVGEYSFIDEKGNPVTDSGLQASLAWNRHILNFGLEKAAQIGNTEYFLSSGLLIARDATTHHARVEINSEIKAKVQEEVAKRKEVKEKESRDAAAAAALNPEPPIIEAPSSPIKLDVPAEPVDVKGSVMSLLNQEVPGRSGTSTSNIETPAKAEDRIAVTHAANGNSKVFGNLKTVDLRQYIWNSDTAKYVEHHQEAKHSEILNKDIPERTYYAIVIPAGNRGQDNVSLFFYRPLTSAEQNKVLSFLSSYHMSDPKLLATEIDNLLFNNPVSREGKSSAAQSSTRDINTFEKKLLKGRDNPAESGTFAGEKDALTVLTSDDEFTDKALDEINRLWPETEDMSMKDIVNLLKSKGKNITSIKDVQAWIDTLKC